MATNSIIMAVRNLAQNPDITGKTIGIQGICDIVEEFLPVYREKFIQEIVKSNAILDAAVEMWHNKDDKIGDLHYIENTVSYEKMREVDVFYFEMYDLYTDGVNMIDRKLFQKFSFRRHMLLAISDPDPDDTMQADQDYDAYMKEQWEDDSRDYDY